MYIVEWADLSHPLVWLSRIGYSCPPIKIYVYTSGDTLPHFKTMTTLYPLPIERLLL